MKPKKLFFSLMAFIIIVIAGCSQKTQENTQVNNEFDRLQKLSDMAVKHPNNEIPDFQLTDNKGFNVTRASMKGKVYIIQGFAPGCSSCAKEIETLNKIYEKFRGKEFDIISLDVASETIEGAVETKNQFNGGDWRWAIDTDNVALKLKMESLESTYIMDRDGIIKYKDEKISNADELSKEIETII